MKHWYVMACLLAHGVFAQAQQLSQTDRVRIMEATRIAHALGDEVWPGFSKAPFAILLVSGDDEYLMRHPAPPPDFQKLARDEELGADIYRRKRSFQPQFLASFPFAGEPTIVVGTADATSRKTSTPWILAVLHEHFHQMQNAQPAYFDGVQALDLAKGDKTGMWMLNYPLPYGAPAFRERFLAAASKLELALQASDADLPARYREYVAARKAIASTLAADDMRYLDFQVWQEGIARYTELRIADVIAARYTPSEQYRMLPDFKPFADEAKAFRADILKRLAGLKDGPLSRESFYPFGAAEAMLLDRARPGWQKRYFSERFSTASYL